MRKLVTNLLFWLLIGFVYPAYAQYFSWGQDPASIRWQQIRTENFQLIFPEDYAPQAQYVADVLEYAYTHATLSLLHRPRRVSVIIHNRTVVSNGFVSWAPRRMELFTNPPPDNDFHDWMERLALHEFRHVVQIDKLNQGLTRVLGYILGEQAVGLMLGLFVPPWFLEGDAVVMETAMTRAGRGRLPEFEQGLRAQVLTHGIYSFDKAMFGSYRHHVPNHYELGYHLVAAGRMARGAEAWAGVVDNVARRPYTITPFSNGMKKHVGARRDKHYKQTFRMLDSLWTLQYEQEEYTRSRPLGMPARHYTSFVQAHFTEENQLIALKTGMKDIPAIVTLDAQGREEVLLRPGRLASLHMHYAARKLVWSEIRTDPRWEHRSWAELWVYDMESHDVRRLTRNSRYFAPALSPDGAKVVALETNPEGTHYALVVLDATTGAELHRMALTDYMMNPVWHPEGRHIAFIALNDQGKRIALWDLQNDRISTLLAPTHHEIAALAYLGKDLVFTGSWTGIDNIYRLRSGELVPERIVSAEFGATYARGNSNATQLIYSDYTAQGYQLRTLDTDSLDRGVLWRLRDRSPAFHRELAVQEAVVIEPSSIRAGNYPVMPYSKAANLFHLHSWAPTYLSVSQQDVSAGATLFFQNMLSTSFASVGYNYNANEQLGRWQIQYTYEGWYPVLSLEAEQGAKRAYYRDQQGGTYPFLWKEQLLKASLSVPLRYRHRAYQYGVIPVFRMGIQRVGGIAGETPDFFLSNNSYPLEYQLYAYGYRRMAQRDIMPGYGHIVDVNYRHSPLGSSNMGEVASIRLITFLPGLLPHQGLRISGAVQHFRLGEPKARTINYSFGELVSYPRGISTVPHQKLGVLSLDYSFPLAYPDWSIRPLIYVKRLRGNIFYDTARGQTFASENWAAQWQGFESYGFDLLIDAHFLRFFSPMSLGIRTLFVDGKHRTELIFGTHF